MVASESLPGLISSASCGAPTTSAISRSMSKQKSTDANDFRVDDPKQVRLCAYPVSMFGPRKNALMLCGIRDWIGWNQGCGSGYFSTVSASTNKNEKTTLTIFLNFCRSVACLLHFIMLKGQKPSSIAITLPTSLEIIVPNYSVFLLFGY